VITSLHAVRDGSAYYVQWDSDDDEANAGVFGHLNIFEAIAESLDTKLVGVRWTGALPIVEFLHCRPAMRDNGFEVECRVFGTTMGGLRVPQITLFNLIAAVQQYCSAAWEARKAAGDIHVMDFAMTVDRGGSLHHGH
jgi:hypothetical protein